MKTINGWEVLTPEGWKDFAGIVEFEKPVLTVTFSTGNYLTGSMTHKVMTTTGMVELQSLVVNDLVKSKDSTERVTHISEVLDTQKVYDLVDVQSTGHQYYTNDIVSHNCDEMAFIPNRVQTDFMAATAPALSATQGKMIVTSTPNGSKDLFAKLWFGSGMVWDKKAYTYKRTNKPKNLFSPLFIPYWIDPTKNNDDWIEREKKTLNDPVKWRIEFECLSNCTSVEVYDTVEEIIRELTLDEMDRILTKDAIDRRFIIIE